MPKTITGDPAYEIKAINVNQLANFDTGKLVKAVGDDLAGHVGKPMQGLVVKAADAKKLFDKLVKSDLPNGKVAQPWLRAGIVGKDMVFLVTDAKSGGKYEEFCVLVKDYVPLRDKLKKQAAEVVNLDPGDKVIDKAAADMAATHGKGGKVSTAADADLGLITGTTPIILLAHGDEDKTSTGQLYGKDFAGKTPQQLVTLLTEHPEPRRRLRKDYAGTIYLDGCFTAQGSAMQNYTKQVWELLRKAGFSKLSVKGNLGLAATTSSGDEIISSTEAKAKAKKLMDAAEAKKKQVVDRREQLLDQLWDAEFKRSGRDANDRFKVDPRVVEINTKAKAALDGVRDELQKTLAKIPEYRVPNLVGTFGLPVLNPRS